LIHTAAHDGVFLRFVWGKKKKHTFIHERKERIVFIQALSLSVSFFFAVVVMSSGLSVHRVFM